MTQQTPTRGELLTLDLVSWGRLGEAMAEYGDRPVFVFGGIPGERVVAQVLRVHRKYVSARVTQVLEPSPDRVEPPCPYFGVCTGCQWQHVSYTHQLSVKRDKVVDALERVGGFQDPPVAAVLPSSHEYGYRNHARFTIGPGGSLGFVNRETREFVRIDECMLMHSGVNELLTKIQNKAWETTQLSIRAGRSTGDYLVQPYLGNPDLELTTGQKHYLDTVDGREFKVSSPSFFQVDVDQTAQMVDVVRRSLDLKPGDILLDAYAGVGTIAVLLAPYVARVMAVEESSAAVADARENAAGLDNVEFLLGKTEDVLLKLPHRPDVVVLDPSRSGCRPEALKSLIQLAPTRVAYVSCDAETLARDLKVLCESAYTLKEVVPLDMFPQTHHVECVALLELAAGPGGVVLASASPRRRELLTEMGLDFQIVPSDVPEEPQPGEAAGDVVRRLSADKALAVAANLAHGLVIGADSMVVLEGEVIGKPSGAAEARSMLLRLRGTSHQVATGVTVVDAASGRYLSDSMTSNITLRDLSDGEIDASIATGTPLDKAGAYAVQDTDLRPAESWDGCYSNIIGLPLCRLGEMLVELGYTLPQDWTENAARLCGDSCPRTKRGTE
ncbi:MAG: 23S rRNA (uracil(1939)-C(5))-methyltransferase RlmD [Chloroflexi bacterium]|nr:23S rRNA (uracil(1939)-C(5))-methyltransferase RlmD [Chloroflexota bacterium]